MNLNPNPAPFKKALGARGETLAESFLLKQGYEILDKNYRCKIGEIDIVAKRGNRVAFVEVKARKTNLRGRPEEAVNDIKQKKLLSLASWYLKEKRIQNAFVEMDVVAVSWAENGKPEIKWIQNAFEKSEE